MNSSELKTIIDFAVTNEVEAYEFYRDAANIIKEESLKELFNQLAEEELKHKGFLENFLNDFLKEGTDEIKLDEFNDYKIAETIDEPKLSINMSFPDAIALAIKKEQSAMELYDNLGGLCLEEDKKDIFLGLKEMEKMHKARLEEIYVNVAYNEIW
ncbi:rubrerythrin [Tissierella creatinini]|nr:rubrerythrin [Tissierella creatinini]TJX66147.1 rubrerythrin [Soehngenia saccharolytica]